LNNFKSVRELSVLRLGTGAEEFWRGVKLFASGND